MPSMRGIPSSYWVHIWYGNTRMAELQSGESHMKIDSIVWAQYIDATAAQPRCQSKCCTNALHQAAKMWQKRDKHKFLKTTGLLELLHFVYILQTINGSLRYEMHSIYHIPTDTQKIQHLNRSSLTHNASYNKTRRALCSALSSKWNRTNKPQVGLLVT